MSSGTNKLAGKVAVVTGASKGIGAEIARQLAQAGAAVVVNYASSKSGAEKVVNDILTSGGKAIAVQGDVSKQADIVRLFADTKKKFGRVDVLVNNAGVYEFGPFEEMTSESFNRQYGLNVFGLLMTTQEALKYFGDAGGSVINVGSVAGKLAMPNGVVYGSTKAAVDSITRSLAAELGPRRIRVNSLNPGMVETEGTASQGITDIENEFRKQVVSQTPLGRIGQVDDIAPVAVFLASDDSKWITGETLYVSGGSR
ncbi:MAG TPA: glucose 1-dehydrogenase [Tepidisphaeraceae bacterium]|nr:glucose 1-dehydrogenase [Tepidisphaeraceae bacterium]